VVDFTPDTREIFKVADPCKKEYIAVAITKHLIGHPESCMIRRHQRNPEDGAYQPRTAVR